MTNLEVLETLNGAEVLAMRKEYYIGSEAGDAAWDEVPCTSEKYSILVKGTNGYKYVIRLSGYGGWCGSGYTTASYADLVVGHVYDNFGPFTHIPKHPSEKLVFETIDNYNVDANYFSYSDWGDEYYPNAYFSVNEDLFSELPRSFKERPVWIFRGQSALGKSTLGMDLSAQGRKVYETDSSADLPDIIYADVIVLGGKYSFTIDEIKKRIFETKNIIYVDFSKGEN